MFEIARGYFRKTVFKTYRYFKHPRRLKQNSLLRWFSRHFLDKTVWKPTQHTLAGGVAVGFFTMMQLVPGQMFFATIFAAVLRVNIPVAIIGCWITNPVTMVPAAVAQIALGNWLFSLFGHVTVPVPDMESAGRFMSFIWHWLTGGGAVTEAPFCAATVLSWIKSMLLGGAVGGVIMAALGYVISWVCWSAVEKFRATRKQPALGLKSDWREQPPAA
jgi:hypothetical protein